MKHRSLRRALGILSICLTLATTAEAQQRGRPGGAMQPPSGSVTGTVVDAETDQPIASATVSLWRSADSTLVTGTITEAEGAFMLEQLRPGQYYVRVSFIGFETQTLSDVAVRPGAGPVALGKVRLAPDTAQLDEVEVTGEREFMEVAIDRTIYNTKDDPATQGGSASELLQKIPSVEVDIDGNVSLRGNQNVAILINGKPSPVSGEFLASFLQQLPANAIERVEVIPNPSAKYDPDGMSGILNIVMKKDQDLGLNGGVNVGLATGDKYNASANVNYQKGRFNVFANYGFRNDNRESVGDNLRENRYLDPLTYLEQDNAGGRDFVSHLFNTTVDYSLDPKSTLSLSAMLSNRGGDGDGRNAYFERDAARVLTDRYDRSSASTSDGFNMDYGLSFRRVLDPSKHELSAEARYNISWDDDVERFTQQALGLDGTPADETPLLETNAQDGHNADASFQVDYMRPVGEKGKVEAGYKGTLRTLYSDFFAEQFDYGAGAYMPRTNLNNTFDFAEQVHAVYGIYGRNLGAFDAQVGVRLEQALTTFDLKTTGTSYDNDYFSVFPSAFLSYSLSETKKLKASYSKRINRPRTRALNPFARYEDPLNLWVGNPYLEPEYTHAFEVGYNQFTKTTSLSLAPYYRRTVNQIERRKTIDGQGVSTTTFENFDSSDSWGAEVIGSLRIGQRFNVNASFNGYRVVTDGSSLDADLSNAAFGWSSRFNASYTIGGGLDVQLFYFYRSPIDVAGGHISSFSMSNIALRQKLMGDRASLSLRLSDVFDQMGFSFQASGDGFYQESSRKWESRVAYLTFTYNFGQPSRNDRARRGNREGEGGGFEDVGIE